MNVAQLKLLGRRAVLHHAEMFPRSNERGSIEASAEAAATASSTRSHVRMNVAQLKRKGLRW